MSSTAEMRRNFLCAGDWPWKLIASPDAVQKRQIRPAHIGLSITNRCNANCPWCCCKGGDRSAEMPFDEAHELLRTFSNWGTKALTITGGGEPTLHESLEAILYYCYACLISPFSVSLVTNGLKWVRDGVPDYTHRCAWIRVSVTEGLDLIGLRVLAEGLKHGPWGLTWTVGEDFDLAKAKAFCEFAAQVPNLTHVRFVDNAIDPVPGQLASAQQALGPLTHKALFQYRKYSERGQNPCYVSRLRPYIDADGMVYPCCSVQYATDEKATLPQKTRMCHWTRYDKQPPFDGSICRRCFYGRTNDVLAVKVNPPRHLEFV